jgi:ATP synthase protein I
VTRDPEPPKSFNDLDTRLKSARQNLDEKNGPKRGQFSDAHRAYGDAWRISAEMFVGLFVGLGFAGGLGWLLDRWLNTSPVAFMVGLFLGGGAGIANVFRVARDANAKAERDTPVDTDRAD